MTTHKTKLNDNQIHILKLIYKFRYVTPTLLAKHRNVLNWTINSSLKTLLDRKLVGRCYNKSYKLQGKAASYFLTSDAIKLLQDHKSLNSKVLLTRSRDKSLSDGFIEHHLNVFRVYLQLRQQYPDRFQMLTKYELPEKHPFNEMAPDLYLNPKTPNSKAYFLDIFDTVPFFVIQERIQAYIAHYDDHKISKDSYPTVLLVCLNSRIEDKVLKYLDSLVEDINFYTTTLKALLSSVNPEDKIWTNPLAPELITQL